MEVVSHELEMSFSSSIVPGVYYPRQLHQRHRYNPRKKKPVRSLLKNGEINVTRPYQNNNHFIFNWFAKLVETRWRWTLLSFVATFTADWLFFGFVYWLIGLHHGDLDLDHLPQNQSSSNWTPCIKNIHSFTSTFLFSIEVHTTVAYGKRSITLECPQAIITMCLQCILSSIFQAFMIGILFAKFTRPKSRTNTILFSKTAVINVRDDKLCLVFRVGDIRKARIFNLNPMAFFVRLVSDSFNPEIYDQIQLDVSMDGCESSFFLWPVSVIHEINKTSPLYQVSAADILSGKLEIIVVLEGIIESTGQTVQARSSFTEFEILWGHRFVSMIDFDEEKSVYNVDFSKLSETEKVDTPLCSAMEYDSLISTYNTMF